MQAQEYWKWPESSWTSETIDWRTAGGITAGVDIGTTSSQAVIMCGGELFGYANMHTGADFEAAADAVIARAMGSSGMTVQDIEAIAGIGWGRRNISYAMKQLDEVQCHAKGARYMYGPEAVTVVDLGAQTTVAIRLYEWDRVWDFMMNDKCATGMGRNIEIMSDLLHVPIEEIGPRSLDVESDPEPVSTTCYAFADTEAIGMFRPGFREAEVTANEVMASYLFSTAWRILAVIGKLQPLDVGDLQIYGRLAFTGGLAKNPGITKRIERELKVEALQCDIDPMLAGAIGAALLASSAS